MRGPKVPVADPHRLPFVPPRSPASDVERPTSNVHAVASLERTLYQSVVVFRLIALVWMAVLVAATVVTVPALRVGVLAAVLLLAVVATAVLQGAARRGLRGTGWLAADAAVSLVVAAGPWLVGTSEPFYGGFPVSAVVLVAFVAGGWWALALAASQVVVIVAGAVAVGSVDLGDLLRSSLTLLVTAWVVGYAIERLRESDRARRDAEAALAVEHDARVRAEERAALGTRLHDSAVQTLVVLRQQADDPDQVRLLARRQERELRAVIADTTGDPVGLAARLVAAADDVEDLHGLHVERVVLGDVGASEPVEAVVAAAKEALVNVARHAGVDRAHLFAQVEDGRITLTVRDRGVGFDPAATPEGIGLSRSVRHRVETAGGTVTVRSTPGSGTEIELEVPIP